MKTAIKRIVVGLDGSPSSEEAVVWAVDMARQIGAHVTAVHAVDIPDDYPKSGGVVSEFHDGWRKTIRAQFENVWCKPLTRARIQYRPVMEEGRAASVITRVADQSGADIIVVGRRGRSRVARLLLGSVSLELVLTSTLPVLVIGPEAVKKRRAGRVV